MKVITEGLVDGENAIIMFSVNFSRRELWLWLEQRFEGLQASAMN
jgi:hypothetical protein